MPPCVRWRRRSHRLVEPFMRGQMLLLLLLRGMPVCRLRTPRVSARMIKDGLPYCPFPHVIDRSSRGRRQPCGSSSAYCLAVLLQRMASVSYPALFVTRRLRTEASSFVDVEGRSSLTGARSSTVCIPNDPLESKVGKQVGVDLLLSKYMPAQGAGQIADGRA